MWAAILGGHRAPDGGGVRDSPRHRLLEISLDVRSLVGDVDRNFVNYQSRGTHGGQRAEPFLDRCAILRVVGLIGSSLSPLVLVNPSSHAIQI